jgi:poly-gamma-glutamate biosynthesis protein PgsC/CapC
VVVVSAVTEPAFSADAAVLVLSLGIVVGLAYYEAGGLSPGGLVSPGVVAVIGVEEPLMLVSIAASAGAAVAITRALRRTIILYGRRELIALMLVATVIQATIVVLLVDLDPSETHVATLTVIVPGLIAFRFNRQPFVPTLLILVSAAALVAVVVLTGIVTGAIPDSDAPGLDADAGIKLAIAVALVVPGMVVAIRRYRRGLSESAAP